MRSKFKKGLKQGDPLEPFLFLMVAEGLSGLMKIVVSKVMYKGFKVWTDGSELSQLLYADDTLFVGEAFWDKLWQ